MKTIAVIFGSRSAEHDVSIITALASVIKPLELSGKYNVEAVYIAKNGSWFWDDRLKDIKLYQTGEIDEFIQKAPKVHLLFDEGLTLVKSSNFAGRKMYKKIDIVFPALHGTHGEDGELMGIMEMANVAYVGCDVFSSAVSMDKVFAKQIVESAGIQSTPWVWCTATELAERPEAVHQKLKNLKYPLFVKPARLGSSIAVSRVTNAEQLDNALEVAAHFDDKIIIEQGVENLIEVTLPIIGNGKPIPAFLEQALFKPGDYFGFEEKYLKGGKGGKSGKSGVGKTGAQGYSKIPADLPKEVYEEAEKTGLEVYRLLNCSGTARVDMLIDTKTKSVYFNEVNPLPGSLYAHNWQRKGISGVELVEKLVHLAEQRHADRQRLQTTFSTNYLKQF